MKKFKQITVGRLFMILAIFFSVLVSSKDIFFYVDSVFYDYFSRHNFLSGPNEEVVYIVAPENKQEISYEMIINKLRDENALAIGFIFENEQKIFNFRTDSFLSNQFNPSSLNSNDYIFSFDNVFRSALLSSSKVDSFHLKLANIYREKRVSVEDIHGRYFASEINSYLVFIKFNNKKYHNISFYSFLEKNYSPNFFKNKIVLIGSESYLNKDRDFIHTPFSKNDKNFSKMWAHASIIDALINGHTISIASPFLLSIFSGILVSILIWSILNLNPLYTLLVTILAGLILFILFYLIFVFGSVYLPFAQLLLSVVFVHSFFWPIRCIREASSKKIPVKGDATPNENYISFLSHDLKTPIAKMSGISDILLQEGRGNSEIIQQAEFLKKSVRELNHFISLILDLAKVEYQYSQINLISKDINLLLTSVADSFEDRAFEKKIEITTNLSPLYPIYLDISFMKRIFSNILENAINYSKSGTKIIISSRDEGEWVVIDFEDQGLGIVSEDLNLIFEKFYRGKNCNENGKIRGGGLGLYLVKRYVELLKGEVRVSSTIGKGSLFQLRFKNE